jgi:hypothetical protein
LSAWIIALIVFDLRKEKQRKEEKRGRRGQRRSEGELRTKKKKFENGRDKYV